MLIKTSDRDLLKHAAPKRAIALSLDVFDTTLIRQSSNQELFRRLGEWAATEWDDWAITPVEFARWRDVSEARANREIGQCKFTLDDIYDRVAIGTALNEERRLRLMDMELELEEQSLIAVPAIKDRIAKERAAGRAVLFLSDMYLPSDWLREVLRKQGLWNKGDRIFVSGEVKASKAAGCLYELARTELNGQLIDPVHVGDNQWSDIQRAEESGWRSQLFSSAKPTRRETCLSAHSPDFGAMPEKLACASRIARLKMQPEASSDLETHLDIATGIAAPIIVSYALWCVRRAQELGLKRLYLMTRDGIVIQDAVDAIIEKLGLEDELETQMLAASRQVCRLSSLDADASCLPDWITYDPHEVTVTSCLYRVGLSPDQFQAELENINLPKQSWEEPLTARQLERLSQLLHQDEFRDAMAETAKDMRDKFESYLAASGLHEGAPSAIIDIGWRGSTFDHILGRLPASARPAVHLFLFGFLGESYEGRNGENIHAYYCDNWRGGGERGDEHLVSLLEDFVAVKEGTLIGFSKPDDQTIDPEFREITHSEIDLERFDINLKAPRAMVSEISADDLRNWNVTRMTPVWKHMLDELWFRPTQSEVHELTRHRQEVDQSGHVSVSLAEPYSWSELFLWATGFRELYSGVSCWSAGRRALTTGPKRSLMIMGERIHRRWPELSGRVKRHKERLGGYLRRA